MSLQNCIGRFRNCISPREQLTAVIYEKVVGLRPKSFARVCKFQKAVNLIEQQNQIEWSAIALDCGYYDQAHFIKEFHAFSGLNPSAYLTQRGDYVNFIPIA
jgi:AraC-like DNA-binding protein